MEILTTSLFQCPLFSPDSIILFENVDGVDKSFKIYAYMEDFFANPLCVPGNCQKIYKLNVHNYLKMRS